MDQRPRLPETYVAISLPTLEGMNHAKELWRPGPTALAAACIVGLALSASTLILLLPTFFHPAAQVHPLVAVGLVALCVTFALGARYWRPSAPGPERR